ncbi:MAG: flavin reductase family protein [Bacteroidota bacterium]
MLTSISRSEVEKMDKVPRLKLINSLSGFKSANLMGTINAEGVENLAIFSSVFHLGSNPPLLGCILRPQTVPRHTYENIKETSWYTVNHVNSAIYRQAHQTSGKYQKELSEFEISGLNSWYSETCRAPYVEAARIRIGLTLVEEHHVEANKTIMLVSAIQEIWIPENCREENGFLDIEKADTVTISGVDAYHTTNRLDKMDYVRVDNNLKRKEYG